ncbi:MAG: TIGR01841 family phasin [Pseudomonadota bacterium]
MADDKTPFDAFLSSFKSFGANLDLPGPQVDQMLDYHRKNLQALQEAAQAASAGGQSLMAKQREALEESLARIAEMVQSVPSAASDPGAGFGDQSDLARQSFEMALKNAGEMQQIATESGSEVFNILRARMEESLSELTAGLSGGDKKG